MRRPQWPHPPAVIILGPLLQKEAHTLPPVAEVTLCFAFLAENSYSVMSWPGGGGQMSHDPPQFLEVIRFSEI